MRDHYELIFCEGGPWRSDANEIGGRGDMSLVANVDTVDFYINGDGSRDRWERTLRKREHGYRKGIMLTVFEYVGPTPKGE